MEVNGVKVIEHFIPKSNTTSRPGYPMKPEYITVHNTGNNKEGANARMHTKYIDTAAGYISWHFTVDDKEIYQELPCNEVAWHAGDGGDGPGNRKSIGIEICEVGDYKKAEDNAAALIVHLMRQYNIPLSNVVPHQKWSGKYCPRLILAAGWDKFIDLVKSKTQMSLKEAVEIIAGKVPGGLDVNLWAGDNKILKSQYIDTLLIKIAKAIK